MFTPKSRDSHESRSVCLARTWCSVTPDMMIIDDKYCSCCNHPKAKQPYHNRLRNNISQHKQVIAGRIKRQVTQVQICDALSNKRKSSWGKIKLQDSSHTGVQQKSIAQFFRSHTEMGRYWRASVTSAHWLEVGLCSTREKKKYERKFYYNVIV